MPTTVWGVVTDRLGATVWESTWIDHRGAAHCERTYALHPAAEFRSIQPARIEVDLNHRGQAVGRVVHLERTADDTLWGVAVLDSIEPSDLDAFGRSWFSATVSAERRGVHRRDIELRSLSITKSPAGVGLAPLRWLAGDIRRPEHRAHWTGTPAIVRSCAQALGHYRPSNEPIYIQGALPRVEYATDDCGHRRPFIDGEPAAVVRRHDVGERVAGMGPVEHAAHRGRVLAVR
jgi:hypothetical protein